MPARNPLKTKEISPLAYVVLLYVVVMSLGLYVSASLIQKIYHPVDVNDRLPPAVSNPDAPESSIEIFLYILVMTLLMLALLKFNLNIIIKILALLALLGGMTFTLYAIFGNLGFITALLLLIAVIWKRQNLLLFNTALILTVTGVGAFLGASLSVLPSLLLLIILSIYDLIAVFWTKHMVTLAEKAKGKMPFMFLIPHRKRSIGLGTGDLAIPLVFTVSVFKDYTLAKAITTSLGGLAGIILLFLYIQGRKKITLPALPPLAVGLIAGFAISML